MGGLEHTTNEWNNPHSTIGTHSEGALRRHLLTALLADTVEDAGIPKPIKRNDDEEGIYCAVTTHSIEYQEGKRSK